MARKQTVCVTAYAEGSTLLPTLICPRTWSSPSFIVQINGWYGTVSIKKSAGNGFQPSLSMGFNVVRCADSSQSAEGICCCMRQSLLPHPNFFFFLIRSVVNVRIEFVDVPRGHSDVYRCLVEVSTELWNCGHVNGIASTFMFGPLYSIT